MIWSDDRTNFERNIAVVIGINEYQKGIHKLSTPVNDARVLADLLETEYEYQVERLFPPYGEATLKNLNDLVSKTLPNKIKPTEFDRLLFYFAGHGIARNSEDGPAGYLVPQDAQLGKLDTFLPMRDLNTALSQLDCHHLLVILDCCFAGNFRWSSTRNIIPIPETIHREHYDRFIRCSAWQAITSAAHNQEALDFLSDLRQQAQNSHHSPFALALIEGLRDSKADLTKDGVVTAPELYLYLRDRLLSKDGYSELQTPGLWPLQKHDRGEFIFTLPGFKREQLKPAPLLNEDNNPYRGLQPYDEKHARFFFGRQEIVERLYKKISLSGKPSSQLIAVLGISGSGKSSLVKAGLIPYLRKNHEKEWQILEPMRPGKSPFIALASTILALANVSSDATSKYVKKLVRGFKKGDSQPLIDKIATWSQANPQVKLLLTIDQFEELITMSRKASFVDSAPELDSVKQKQQNWLSKVFRRHSKDKNNNQTEQKDEAQQEWHKFLALLINALNKCPQLYIVLTLRSDFEARFVESTLKDYWDQARFPVRPMRADELREAIEKPASEMALYFEPANAVDRLIDEVGEMPGALPLLSFTLSELYIKLHQAWVKEGKEDRALTVDEQFYQQGGIAGSLTYRANEIYYDGLPDEAHRDTMRRVMLRMVEIQGGEAVRRQVPESELFYSSREENQRREKVIQSLVDARLVVKGQETGEPYVEPAHDFLVRGWTKLQEWQEQAQKTLSIEVQRRLTQAANDWNSTNQKREQQGLLWNDDPRLAFFEQMLPPNVQQYKPDGKFRYFLQQFGKWIYRRQVLQQQKEIKENAGEANLLNQREQEFVLKSLNLRYETLGRNVGIFIIVLLLVSGLSGLAWILRGQAVSNEKNAIARQLAAQSGQVGSQQIVQLSALLAVESMQQFIHVDPSIGVEADQALRNALFALPLSTAHHNAIVNNIVFSPDARYFATASDDKTAKIWAVNSGKEIRHLLHNDNVRDIAFSPDGKYVATASDDKTVRLWEATTGREVAHISYKSVVISVTFSPDGKYFAIACDDKTIRVRDVNRLQEVAQFPDSFYYRIYSKKPLFSPDSRYIITISSGTNAKLWEVKLWDVKIRREIAHFRQAHDIRDFAFSPDGKYFATASQTDNSVKLWDVSSHKEIATLKHESTVVDIKFSPDSKYLATATGFSLLAPDQNRGWLWEIKSSKVVEKVASFHPNQGLNSVAFSPDSGYLATASEDNTARIWNIQSRQEMAHFAHDSNVKTVAFSPDGKYLATVSNDIAGVWDVSNSKQLRHRFHVSNRNQITFSPDEKYLTTASQNKDVRILELNSGKEISVLRCDVNVKCLSLSPDGKYLATISNDKTVQVWDTNSSKQIFSIPRDFKVNRGAFSPDNKYFAMVCYEKMICLWEIRTKKEIYKFNVNSKINNISSLFLSNNGKYIAVGSFDDKTVEVLDVYNQKTALLIPPRNDGMILAALSPDGHYIVTIIPSENFYLWDVKANRQITYRPNAQSDSPHSSSTNFIVKFSLNSKYFVTAINSKTARLWESKSGKEIRSFPHDYKITTVAFSPDNKYIATGSEDKTARMWDVKKNPEIARIPHDSMVNAIAFSPYANYLATASHDGTLLFLRWPKDLIAEACSRLTRNLTWNEWRQYFSDNLNLYSKSCPNLPIDPSFIAEVVEKKDVKNAVAILRRILEQNPNSNLNSTAEARRLVAPDLLKKGETLVKQAKVKEALAVYTDAQNFDRNLKITSSSWGVLCRFGSLHGYASKVMYACEKAVALEPDSFWAADSRGLARALTGNIKGAILDFQASINLYQSQPIFGKIINSDEYKLKRQAWINTLRLGQNPFTKKEMKSLLGNER